MDFFDPWLGRLTDQPAGNGQYGMSCSILIAHTPCYLNRHKLGSDVKGRHHTAHAYHFFHKHVARVRHVCVTSSHGHEFAVAAPPPCSRNVSFTFAVLWDRPLWLSKGDGLCLSGRLDLIRCNLQVTKRYCWSLSALELAPFTYT